MKVFQTYRSWDLGFRLTTVVCGLYTDIVCTTVWTCYSMYLLYIKLKVVLFLVSLPWSVLFYSVYAMLTPIQYLVVTPHPTMTQALGGIRYIYTYCYTRKQKAFICTRHLFYFIKLYYEIYCKFINVCGDLCLCFWTKTMFVGINICGLAQV